MDLFALHVHGDSMIDAGIYDGDIVIVEQTSAADNGQIIAAMIGGEAMSSASTMRTAITTCRQ